MDDRQIVPHVPDRSSGLRWSHCSIFLPDGVEEYIAEHVGFRSTKLVRKQDGWWPLLIPNPALARRESHHSPCIRLGDDLTSEKV